MGKLLEELRNFLSTATSEQLEQAWKEVEPFKDVGPTLDEFIADAKTLCSIYNSCILCCKKDNCIWKEEDR